LSKEIIQRSKQLVWSFWQALEPGDATKSKATLDLIRCFIFEGLNVYDEESLESMGVADYFHPRVQWYGPGGIGAWRKYEHHLALLKEALGLLED
jgi:hypothetical protein